MSGEIRGEEVDLRALTDPAAAAGSGVAHAGELVALADAMVGEDDAALGRAREDVRRALGPEALVDAVAVVSNFERMVRIADGTGIALDAPVETLSAELRDELGLGRFASAGNTPAAGPVRRVLATASRPLLRRLIRWLGARGARSGA